LLPLRLCGYGAVLRALGETRAVFSSSVAGLLTNAVLIYPLYLLLGLAGPALASVIALVVAIAMLLARIKGALALSWRTVMPWRRLGRSFGVAGAAAVPLIGLLVLVPSDGLRLVAGAAMLLPVYLWLGHRAGVIAGGDLAYLGRLLSLRTLWERRSGRGGEG
jgi:O-antigen/teichoic acid export membrane protein